MIDFLRGIPRPHTPEQTFTAFAGPYGDPARIAYGRRHTPGDTVIEVTVFNHVNPADGRRFDQAPPWKPGDAVIAETRTHNSSWTVKALRPGPWRLVPGDAGDGSDDLRETTTVVSLTPYRVPETPAEIEAALDRSAALEAETDQGLEATRGDSVTH